MTEQQKATLYGNLLNEHTKLFNQISQIKSENLEMNPQQMKQVRELEMKQAQIMEQVKRMFN
jgi:hypothetical protein